MRRLLAGLLLVAGAAGADPGLVVGEPAVDCRDGVYSASLRLSVAAPRPVALAVLTDFDRMAGFMPNLAESRIVERSGNVYRVAQSGRASFGPLSFAVSSERRIEVTADGRILARGLSGSTRQMRSELRLSAAGPAETRIDYSIEVEPDTWLPCAVGRRFLRHELTEQFTAMGREMLRRPAAD